MQVSHLSLANWRNFRQVDVPLRKRMFFIGPNASGKSNLLDVFRFLRDVAKGQGGGLQAAVKERGGLPKIRCLAARANPTVRIEVDISEGNGAGPRWKYALGITQETRGYRRPLVESEAVWRDGKQVLSRPDAQDDQDSERLTETHLEQTTANKQFREVALFLSSALYLHLVPQLLRNPWAFSGPGIPGDPYGRRFLERLAKTTDKTRNSRLKRIEKALKCAVPQLTQLRFTKDEVGMPHLEALYEHWRPNAGKQQEDQFSDGTLRLIGLLWSLMESNSLLLLEEPELSLNSEVVKVIPPIMHKVMAKSKRQVFISTHSFDLLSDRGISGEETLVITADREGSVVQIATRHAHVRAMLEAGMSVAEAALPLTAPREVQQLSLDL
jgi:predicted ATPase